MKKLNTWKYHIEIKQFFQENVMPDGIIKLSDSIIFQLKRIQKQVRKSNLVEDRKEWADIEIDNIIDNFDFLKSLADESISKKEWNNYDFDGNFEEWGNKYLSELYDLGDARVLNTKNEFEKFMWVR